MSERTNAGFTIIESVKVENTEFVLGKRNTNSDKYVTWACKDGDNYYWGHYMSDYYDARLDLFSRASEQINYLRSIGAISPSKKNKDYER